MMIQSVLFRVIIICTSVWIILHNNPSLPYSWLYIALIIVYFISYLILRIKEKSILRLFVDFTFMNVIVYGADVYSPIIFLFILLPIINAINFSGKSNHFLLLLILTLGTFFIHANKFSTQISISLLILSLMYLYSQLKYREWKTEKEISKHIDDYFLNPEQIDKPHHIYKRIINDLNQFFYLKQNDGIRKIIAYTLKDNILWLVNSSEFLWERYVSLDDDTVVKLRKIHFVYNIEVDKVLSMFYINKKNVEYVFVIEMPLSSKYILSFPNYKDIMLLTFSKASMLLNAEYRVRMMREKKFDEIKDNVLYVNQAVKVMHYIRNKLTPISNIVAYHKISDSIKDATLLSEMKKRINKEVVQADNDLKEILYFADYLLDKSNNPFIDTDKTDISISKLFIVTSEIVQRLLNGIVDIDSEITNEKYENFLTTINLIECKIMLTDWVTNIYKYKKKYHKVFIDIEDEALVIHFENDYSCSEERILKLVRDLNSKSKDAVLEGKGSGHGLYIIKSIADKHNVDIFAKLDNNIICLDLKFTIYERKENINI